MKINVIKIGGNIVDNPEVLNQFVEIFSQLDGAKVLVHGGGKIATKISASLGIETQMVEGRRITDKDSLDVVTMVYAGLINKNLVAKTQAKGCKTIGLCGADANIIRSHKRTGAKIDYGFVGDVDEINTSFLEKLVQEEYIPVIAPITHNKEGQLLNTNADTITSEIAVALAKNNEVQLTYCFELLGVMKDIKDETSILSKINPAYYQTLKAEKIIVDGMIPKLDNCFNAIKKGVHSVRICHALKLTSEIGTILNS